MLFRSVVVELLAEVASCVVVDEVWVHMLASGE